MDILFQTDTYIFSYRIAGICIHDGRVLLQKPTNDDGYAFPGGHSALGETHEATLIREFREEIGADIEVGDLKWVAEIFFPWDGKPCHQLCLYYQATILSPHIPRQGKFPAKEHMEGRNFAIEFHWVPLEELSRITVYPPQAAALLQQLDNGVQHFVYRE